jgi:serine/threonine-protein kinase
MPLALLPPAPPPSSLRISAGRLLSLDEELGRGAQGRVVVGRSEERGECPVAVRLFGALTPESRARVGAAAEAAARVCDPRVAQIFDHDLNADSPYVVSELVDGCSLEALLHEYARTGIPFSHDVGIMIALKVAEGLAGALEARTPAGGRVGLVHGSLCPRDVLLSWTGEVKVSDFGLTTSPVGSSAVHSKDAISARLAAIAPELLSGVKPNERSDVFSLGVLLFELLIGPRFPEGMTVDQATRMVESGKLPPNLVEVQLSGPLRALLRKCTQKDPSKRYANAREVADELRSLALLLGIPDVPAFIGRALAAVAAPEVRELGGFSAGVINVVADSVIELDDRDLLLEGLDFGPTIVNNDV